MLAWARESTTQSFSAASVSGGIAGSSGGGGLGIGTGLRARESGSASPLKISTQVVSHRWDRPALDPDGGGLAPKIGPGAQPVTGLRLPLVDHLVEHRFGDPGPSVPLEVSAAQGDLGPFPRLGRAEFAQAPA